MPDDPTPTPLYFANAALRDYLEEVLETTLEAFEADGGQFHGRLSPDEIAALKQKHDIKSISELIVKIDEKNLAFAYLRPPSLSTIGRAHRLDDSDFDGLLAVVFQDCWLAGHEAIKADEGLLMQCIGPATSHLAFTMGVIKKH